MNYTYGFPLFSPNESKKAFNYLYHFEEDNNSIRPEDLLAYNFMTSSDESKQRLIIISNSKRVQNIVVDKLLPNLSLALTSMGQNHGFITINPTQIMLTHNPFVAKTVDKCIPYIHSEMRCMSNIWMYFDGFINKELEQIIKLKYPDYITIDGKTVYIKISPDENFSLIYDLIDDILSHS